MGDTPIKAEIRILQAKLEAAEKLNERLRKAYLEVCEEHNDGNCSGDMSVGIQPCEFWCGAQCELKCQHDCKTCGYAIDGTPVAVCQEPS